MTESRHKNLPFHAHYFVQANKEDASICRGPQGLKRVGQPAADQRHQEMRIIASAAMDIVLAAIDRLLVLEGGVFRAIRAEHGELEPRPRFEPGAGGKDLDLDRNDLAGADFFELLMRMIRP